MSKLIDSLPLPEGSKVLVDWILNPETVPPVGAALIHYSQASSSEALTLGHRHWHARNDVTPEQGPHLPVTVMLGCESRQRPQRFLMEKRQKRLQDNLLYALLDCLICKPVICLGY